RRASIAPEGFYLAFRHSSQVPETHVAWKLCETQSVIVATHAYLERRGYPESPADLSAHHCLVYPRALGSGIGAFERRAARRTQSAPLMITVNGPFSANNSEALRDAALDDL